MPQLRLREYMTTRHGTVQEGSVLHRCTAGCDLLCRRLQRTDLHMKTGSDQPCTVVSIDRSVRTL